jgi:beta-lactamase superfamily II metal-dependent hydrolase
MDAPVVVYPPGPGGRRVTVRGEHAGTATSVVDVLEFLRRAGLDDLDVVELSHPDLIEWRGGGPQEWE